MDCGRQTSIIALVVLATWTAGCGTKRTNPDSGSTEVSTGDTPALGDGVIGAACEPGLQDCPAGSKCDFFCTGANATIGCRADDGAGVELGMICGGSRVCKKGSGCFAAAGSNALCRQYCTSDGDCTTGQCQTATIAIACGGVSMPLMMKVCF